jgi:D-glycero-D-manno-heptose 1,7-bisphosphate phosphatase
VRRVNVATSPPQLAPDVTLRRCLLGPDAAGLLRWTLGERPALYWLLRELSRFGVSEVLLPPALLHDPATAAAAALLPRALALAPHPAGAVAERMLLCDGTCVFDANLARLLADSARDGVDVALRRAVLPDGGPLGVAVVRGGAVPAAATSAPEATVLAGARARTGRGGADLLAPLRRPALFLDRDGTINIDHGYVGTRERFEWVAGARAAIRRATDAGWHVFIVTNQSGVARGYYDEHALAALHRWLADEVRREGGTIDDIRYCPYHPDAADPAYRRVSPWRKPAPGMILDLIAAWELAPESCVMVGDQPADMAAARAAGIDGRLFAGGDLDRFVAPLIEARKPSDGAPSESH